MKKDLKFLVVHYDEHRKHISCAVPSNEAQKTYDEYKKFYKKDTRSKAIMTGIGYKELYSYFDKEITLEEAIDLIKKNSRHLAKRQYTFFNNQFDDIKWIQTDYENFNNTVDTASKYIKG